MKVRPFEVFDGLSDEIPPIPEGSVVSRTVLDNPRLKVVLLGFAAGEEIAEPAPEAPAIFEVWRGTGTMTLDTRRATSEDTRIEESYLVGPGSWIYVEAGTAHALQASTELVVLLTIFK